MRLFPYSIRGLALIAAALMAMAAPSVAAEFSDDQKAEIRKIVGDYIKDNPEFIREYLLSNPEILLEVSDVLRAQQIRREQEASQAALTAHRAKLERHPMTPVTGNPDGDVTLIEFFDYNCTFCKRVFSYVREIEKNDPKLRVVWKEYPILAGRSPTSMLAAKAAMAAHKQGKYIEAHVALMGVRGSLTSEAQVMELVAGTGVDMDQLKKDMESPEIKAYIQETMSLGEALKFQGTPTFVVNGAVIGGAVPKEFVVAVIAAARANDLKPGELSEEDLGAILKKYGS